MREALRAARIKAGKSQQKIADESGIERSLYNKIERGNVKNVSYVTAVRIAKAVFAHPDDIFLPVDVIKNHKQKGA